MNYERTMTYKSGSLLCIVTKIFFVVQNLISFNTIKPYTESVVRFRKTNRLKIIQLVSKSFITLVYIFNKKKLWFQWYER